MTTPTRNDWPVLTRYEGANLRRVALPLGGIGTGTVSLGGRGNLHDWEIVNRPAKGFQLEKTFFALFTRDADGNTCARALEGAIPVEDFEGATGSLITNHGLPRFRNCRFEAAYPFGQVLLDDGDVPLQVRLQAFNPLVPGDAAASELPLAMLRFELTNTGDQPVEASVCGSLLNFIGTDGSQGAARRNVNEYRDGAVRGLFMRSDGVEPGTEQFGTLALTTTAGSDLSWRTAWQYFDNRPWGDSLLDFWDDFSDDGRLEDRDLGNEQAPIGSLAANVTVAPGSSESVTFLLCWHFPNRLAWPHGWHQPEAEPANGVVVGNHYTTRFTDAWEAAEYCAANLTQLESDTLLFVNSFLASDVPDVVKESALYNVSTLRSQTTFRTPDGYTFGWEGCHDNAGCCFGSCTHVWNYEQATAFLFGELSAGMREVEFLYATREDGGMSFRVHLPLEQARSWSIAAADGQMGCIMRMHRDWQLKGDDDWLRRLWPAVRRSLEFCWYPGGWDADQDGVMEGCQHNTMDVEYYGPNPQMGIWYLGALRASEEIARHLGETEFADKCRSLFTQGSAWLDANLFNGEYYEHEIRPADNRLAVRDMLTSDMGAADPTEPVLQLGPGCLVDQLVGQFQAHVNGLGYLVDEANVRSTLDSIMRYNFRESFYGHFNHMRSYVLNDESALLMASYPRGGRPKRPFPYFNEVMTGFEYTAAIGMLYEGQMENGLRCIEAVRARYDGQRRSPFNEAECGHHYARAMISWAALLALSGFQYSGVTRRMAFARSEEASQQFWSNGYAWGMFRQTPGAAGVQVELEVLRGELSLREFALTDYGSATFSAGQNLGAGECWQGLVRPN